MVKDFFATLYEWFGLVHFYSKDLGEYLRGLDFTCTDYTGTPWYLDIGWIMIGLTVFVYFVQYHLIDSSRFNKAQHWWIVALAIAAINFIVAFAMPFYAIQIGDHCKRLHLSGSDCVGFGLSNAIWSLILFVVITSTPLIRKFSKNSRYTTFWKHQK